MTAKPVSRSDGLYDHAMIERLARAARKGEYDDRRPKVNAAMNAPDLKTYKRERIKLLKRDFLVRFSDEELQKLNDAKTEIAFDNIARTILKRWLNG